MNVHDGCGQNMHVNWGKNENLGLWEKKILNLYLFWQKIKMYTLNLAQTSCFQLYHLSYTRHCHVENCLYCKSSVLKNETNKVAKKYN